jgi:hypothetical protein
MRELSAHILALQKPKMQCDPELPDDRDRYQT